MVLFGSLFGTILASFSESNFGVISGIVLGPILVVLVSPFGFNFAPKMWIDAKRVIFEN